MTDRHVGAVSFPVSLFSQGRETFATPNLSRAESFATLARAGWGQVVACSVSAPHQSRFERVPGGWRPLLRGSRSGKSALPWQSQTPVPLEAPPMMMTIPNIVTTSVDASDFEPGWKSKRSEVHRDSQSTVSSGSRHSHAPTQMSEDLAERFYDDFLPHATGRRKAGDGQHGRMRRRDPAFSSSSWTARLQAQQKCRPRPIAPCIYLAFAMTAHAKKLEDANQSLIARQLDCDSDDHGDSLADPDLFGSDANKDKHEILVNGDQLSLAPSNMRQSDSRRGKARSRSKKPVGEDEAPARRRKRAAHVFESEDCLEVRANLPAALVRGLPNVIRSVQEVAEKMRISQAGNLLFPDALKMREMHEMKLALYADLLAKDENVTAKLDQYSIRPDEVAELAQVFAELDGHPHGFIGPASLRTVLRRVGRLMTAWKISNLLDKLWESSHMDEARNERFLEKIDFVDVVAVFGLVLEQENYDLQCVWVKLRDPPVEIHKLNSFLEDIDLSFKLSFDHLRRTANQLGLLISSHIGLHVDVKSEGELLDLINQCRKLEKMRVHDYAGFKSDEVDHLSRAYHRFVRGENREEIDPKDLLSLLDHLHIITNRETPEQYQHLMEVLENADSDSSGSISFFECLHLVRRLFDEAEVHAILLERTAQEVADLSWDDVDGLREIFDQLCEESAEPHEFDYVALIKAVRRFGGTPTTAQLSHLEVVFKTHALPSRKEQHFHLSFPEFLRTMGELWKEDFAGIFTSAEKWATGQESNNSDSPKARSSQTSTRSTITRTIVRIATKEW